MAGIGQTRSEQNINPARSGYSAIVDAEDLAAFIQVLHLGKVVVIGHSYGALTALFPAVKHPELVRALVWPSRPLSLFWPICRATKSKLARQRLKTFNGEWSRLCSKRFAEVIAMPDRNIHRLRLQ
jgi:predicted alpha/beta superfamily hydrolase